MGQCAVCHRRSDEISSGLGLCAACAVADGAAAREPATRVHARAREPFGLPPRAPEGARCERCVNACRIAPGEVGYCGVRANEAGRVTGGNADAGAVQWYYDPLPTNCVADWACPASTAAGYPEFTDTTGPEAGWLNLAVFYEACSFDCLYCQNWHFRRHSVSGSRHTAERLAAAVSDETRCVCFFGGDPTCQVEHALAAARAARQGRRGRILRICWETNGSVAPASLDEMARASCESGGCVKVDLKAWDDGLHRALCGVSNRRTLANFERLAGWIARRPDPPMLVASTLLVPGYVDAEQVGRIARFLAGLDRDIPYALLAFHPTFEMRDLPTTSRRQAERCLDAAEAEGLRRVRVGNLHLLR
jgi:pyruvate formate lyase activating enzyme